MKSKDDNKKIKKSFNVKALMNMDIKEIKNKIPYKKINVKKMLPEKKKKVVAFDIGSMVIKIAEGTYYKKELIIDKCMKFSTPKGSVIDGEIKKDNELITRIKEFLNENKIHAKYGICTTNSTTIINREILIPNVEEEELDTVVRYEIQQYLPINLDDYVLQVKVLSEDKTIEGLDKLNVRVIAYPQKMARSYYNLLEKLDLKPYALDVNYNAMEKLINYTQNRIENNNDNSIAYIDMGAEFINVNIYKNRNLDFTRIIKAGGNDIDDYLQKLTGMSHDELEKMKRNDINLYNDENADNFVVREVVNEWIEKIEKIINFYKNKSMGNNVDEIIIFGGSSELNGIDKYFEEKLQITTKRIGDISKVGFKLDSNNMPIDDFINVIGSVIRL